jgi:DNA-binding response OmpR family regulator
MELAQHAGQVLVIDHLLEHVWGLGYEGEKRLVWRMIHLLRQKIEPDPSEPQYILTRPGIGYLLAAPETTSSES